MKIKGLLSIMALFPLVLSGCSRNNAANDVNGDTTAQALEMGHYVGKHVTVFRNDTIPFFGKTIIMDDSTHIIQQIKNVADEDDFLSFDGHMLIVGKVEFGINLHSDGVVLISNTLFDSPQAKMIVKYLNNLYTADPDNNESQDQLWRSKEGYNNIRMRPLHSDGGGTVLQFQN